MMTTAIDWAPILLADDSDASLLIWADYLEDAGDEACRGVREFLVHHKRRPRPGHSSYQWWFNPDDTEPYYVPFDMGLMGASYIMWYFWGLSSNEGRSQETAHYAALYEAASGWVKWQSDIQAEIDAYTEAECAKAMQKMQEQAMWDQMALDMMGPDGECP